MSIRTVFLFVCIRFVFTLDLFLCFRRCLLMIGETQLACDALPWFCGDPKVRSLLGLNGTQVRKHFGFKIWTII